MPPLALALLTLGLAPDPTPMPASPTAEIITVVCSGIVGILVAVTGLVQVRRRKAAEAEATLTAAVDLEDRPSRLRERLSTLEAWARDARSHNLPDRVTLSEARLDDASRRINDLEEKMDLRRAADVVIESGSAPRRRRPDKP